MRGRNAPSSSSSSHGSYRSRPKSQCAVGGLPVAVVPLWQLAQEPVTDAWSKRTVVQFVVTWQLSQPAEVAMCVGGLPVAVVPLWQLAQEPVTDAWSKRTVVQFVVTWQLSQPAEVAMCVGGLPVAVVPLWQLAQEPVTDAWSKRTDVQCSSSHGS